jgi:hypothetical protein
MPKVDYHWALNYSSKGLTSAPDRGECSNFMPQLLNPKEETRVPSEEEARVGPRASLDIMEKTNTTADTVHTKQPTL